MPNSDFEKFMHDFYPSAMSKSADAEGLPELVNLRIAIGTHSSRRRPTDNGIKNESDLARAGRQFEEAKLIRRGYLLTTYEPTSLRRHLYGQSNIAKAVGMTGEIILEEDDFNRLNVRADSYLEFCTIDTPRDDAVTLYGFDVVSKDIYGHDPDP